jgi:hypothetical protein
MHREPKRYFSNTMFSPYFQSKHYSEESVGSQMEIKIENKILLIKNKLFFWRKK